MEKYTQAQPRWIRLFASGLGLDDRSDFGKFIGVRDFADICAIRPCGTNAAFLYISIRGDEGGQFKRCADGTLIGINMLMVLKADLHMIDPALAATFPMESA